MGAGLSMASVNKIKELANSREYGLALELVEHQDLTKSLNPQFLRLCGEIYIKNNRPEDARRCLIMAHRLGPESKRIIYVFVDLYLRMGYFDLAKTYYDMYMFDSSGHDSRQMEYIWNKHRIITEGTDSWKELEPLLAGYAHNLDQDWSFELFLLYRKEEKNGEADSLAQLYAATYRNSDLSQVMADIQTGTADVDSYFTIYPAQASADEDPAFEQLRAEERELLEADDLRMHPKEAEITVMYEDAFTPAESEKTVQRMLRKQDKDEQREEKRQRKKEKHEEKLREKQRRKNRKSDEPEPTDTSQPDAETVTEKTKAVQSDMSESMDLNRADQTTDVRTEEAKPQDRSDEEEERLKAEALKVWLSPDDEEDQTTGQAKSMKRKGIITIEEDDGFEAEADTIEELAKKETSEIGHAETVDVQDAAETHADTSENGKPASEKPAFVFQTMELAPEDQNDGYEVDDFTEQTDDEFGEMHPYTPEEPEVEEVAETEPEPAVAEIEEVAETEPEIEENVEVESEPEVETVEETVEIEPEPVIEDVEMTTETESEIIEPESEVEEDAEIEPEPLIEEVEEIAETESEIIEPEEPAVEETAEIEPEPAVEEVEEIAEAEPEIEGITETESEIIEPEPAVEETVEIEPEPVIEEVEEIAETESEIEEITETEPEIIEPEETSVEETAEIEPEPVVEEVVETEPESEVEPVEETVETESEPEIVEVEPESEVEPVEETVETESEPEFHVAPFTTKPEKKKLDFPVFRSSLFPDYHNETKQVENNFDEIVEQAQDKMSENMRKEEQMQREAEALLASLGISLDSPSAGTVKKEEPPQKKGPSRDEMKASLKIDSVKKDLLKRIKEYR